MNHSHLDGNESFGPLVAYRIEFRAGVMAQHVSKLAHRIVLDSMGRATACVQPGEPLCLAGVITKAQLSRYQRMHREKQFFHGFIAAIEAQETGEHGLITFQGQVSWNAMAEAIGRLSDAFGINASRLENHTLPRIPFSVALLVFSAHSTAMARLFDAIAHDPFWRPFTPLLLTRRVAFDHHDDGGSHCVEIEGKQSTVGLINSLWRNLAPAIGPMGYIDMSAQEVYSLGEETGQPWRSVARIGLSGEPKSKDDWQDAKSRLRRWAKDHRIHVRLRRGQQIVFQFDAR